MYRFCSLVLLGVSLVATAAKGSCGAALATPAALQALRDDTHLLLHAAVNGPPPNFSFAQDLCGPIARERSNDNVAFFLLDEDGPRATLEALHFIAASLQLSPSNVPVFDVSFESPARLDAVLRGLGPAPVFAVVKNLESAQRATAGWQQAIELALTTAKGPLTIVVPLLARVGPNVSGWNRNLGPLALAKLMLGSPLPHTFDHYAGAYSVQQRRWESNPFFRDAIDRPIVIDASVSP